jgi:5-methylthioribose kinase
MTLRSDFTRDRPDFPVLTAGDVQGLTRFASSRGWLERDEVIEHCDRAGDGNMNLTLRVKTDRRSVVLKQARPWVEKYDEIPAPIERANSERMFYERAATLPGVAAHMPNLLHTDGPACVIVLEDLGDGTDLTSLYAGGDVTPAELDVLARYLASLHEGWAGPERNAPGLIPNDEMRALNHEHMFVVPLADDTDLPLDEYGRGLAEAARELRANRIYRELVRETSARYLGVEATDDSTVTCQLHGDYFPGSWLRSEGGLRVIDPEFTFPGDREVDVGCAAAHLALAGRKVDDARYFTTQYEHLSSRPLDPVWLARYAAIEVMRRLIGVAQLPLPVERDGSRAALLQRSGEAMLGSRLEALFA